MKRVLALMLSLLMIAACGISAHAENGFNSGYVPDDEKRLTGDPAYDDDPFAPQAKGGRTAELAYRYGEQFYSAYPYCIDTVEYRELYRCDADGDGLDEWALVQARDTSGLVGGGYGVFDEVVVFSSEFYPFKLGYGVYDVMARRFYGLDEAWDMGFGGLHDVFVHLMMESAESYCLLLGDADLSGEVDIIDVTRIQRYLVDLGTLDDDEPLQHSSPAFGERLAYLSDFDRDGDRSIRDATMIQRYLLGMGMYRHGIAVSAEIGNRDGAAWVDAQSSFGSEPITYCYTIKGTVNAMSSYDYAKGFGDFLYAPTTEPGDFYVSTGYIAKDHVEIPIDSLTFGDRFTLTVTARDARGTVSAAERIDFSVQG